MVPLIGIFGSVCSSIAVAAIVALWRMMRKFVREQREENKRNAEFRHSQELAEITRMFQRAVEDGKPVTHEELSHLEATYAAYHGDGCNGVGTMMYERIKEHAVLKTRADYEKGGA